MSRRAMLGGVIVAAWLAGLGVLVQREYFRPQLERLAEAAVRVTPAVVYYGVMRDGRQVGFASSTIDTAQTFITLSDYLVADVAGGRGGTTKRTAAWTDVTLTRGMRVSKFDTELDTDAPPRLSAGRFIGDSALVYGIGTTNQRIDSQHVSLPGPVLLPALIPLAVVLGQPPRVGRTLLLPILDPTSMQSTIVTVRIAAETLFTIPDSAVFDSTSMRWRAVTPDTVRAWHLAADGAAAGTDAGFDGWVDEQGRVVRTTRLGFALERMPYELAFENWKADSLAAGPRGGGGTRAEISSAPAIGAKHRVPATTVRLALALRSVDLSRFAIDAPTQRVRHDTLLISLPSDSALAWPSPLPMRDRAPEYLQFDRSIQSRNPVITSLAQRIVAGSRDANTVARRLVSWVHDSIADRAPTNPTTAIGVLARRWGDAADHAQLFMALARAAGLPARGATGLLYLDGKFYYHAWSEVLLNDWVAADPTFGDFPADAAHVRFATGDLVRQPDMLRLIGTLEIDVLAAATAPARRSASK